MIELFLTYLLGVVVLLYLSQSLLLYSGSRKLDYTRKEWQPNISILVALRNETLTVEKCVQSLLKLDYPPEKLNIILIDDRSTDGTSEIVAKFADEVDHVEQVQVNNRLPGLSGKANAIAQAMDLASGEIILITDGDCELPESWAKSHVSFYCEDIGMVAGFTLLDRKGEVTTFFGKIQSLDWAYLLSVGSGAIGHGLPLSVLGNNLSFRREAYEQVGGYRKMEFTIIEDFALMKTFLKRTDWQVRYPVDPHMLVFSHPMPDFAHFYSQRKRWSAGGKEVGFYGKFLMAVSYLAHVLSPLSFLFLSSKVYASLALGLLILADFFLLFRTTRLIKRKGLLRYFIPWEFFYFAYTTLFAPVLLFPTTICWKDVTYKWRFNWTLKGIFEGEPKT